VTTLTLKFEVLEHDNLSPSSILKLERTKIGNFLIENDTRFRFSQIVDSILWYHTKHTPIDQILKIESIDASNGSDNYIIPIAVAYHPADWADTNTVNRLSIFELINPKFLSDLQNGKAMILIDQSVEGYHTEWLWDWFHSNCEKYNIPPNAIIYATGDQSSLDNYDQWICNNTIDLKINVIPSTVLSFYIYQTYVNRGLDISFNNILEYKMIHSSEIYLYDCINMRPRLHRIFNYLHLESAGLIPDGNISIGAHPDWETKLTTKQLTDYRLPCNTNTKIIPRAIAQTGDSTPENFYEFVERILDRIYLNSWVSIVTESSYFSYECSTFISEKTFKPIACMQPFIIVGSKHTLKYLRKLGYRTFDGFIDETYDELDDAERFLAITIAINKIKKIEDKVSWYRSMQEIVEHNHRLFLSIGSTQSREHCKITEYYNKYFWTIK
jgi:hypothetical protein